MKLGKLVLESQFCVKRKSAEVKPAHESHRCVVAG